MTTLLHQDFHWDHCYYCSLLLLLVYWEIPELLRDIFTNHSKTPTTYFVVNYAISDLIVCLTFFLHGLSIDVF